MKKFYKSQSLVLAKKYYDPNLTTPRIKTVYIINTNIINSNFKSHPPVRYFPIGSEENRREYIWRINFRSDQGYQGNMSILGGLFSMIIEPIKITYKTKPLTRQPFTSTRRFKKYTMMIITSHSTIQRRLVKKQQPMLKHNTTLEQSNPKKARIDSSVLYVIMIEGEENTNPSTTVKNTENRNITEVIQYTGLRNN